MPKDYKFKRDLLSALQKIARELEKIRRHFTEPNSKEGTGKRKT